MDDHRGHRSILGSRGLLALVVLLAAVGPYLGTLGHDFLNWDDAEYVPQNELLRDPGGLLRIWTSLDDPQFYPMVFTSYWLEFHLWGSAPAGYHAINILLHAIASLLLLRLLLQLGLPASVAFASALLFAAHPTQVASVAWVSERKNVLSGVFYFLCLQQYLSALQGRGRGHLVWSWILGALAMLSKTTTVTLPLTALLLEAWVAGEALAAGPVRRAGVAQRTEGAWKRWARPAVLFVPALLAAGVTLFREHGPVFVSDVSLPERIGIAARALWFDAGKLLAPIRLSGVYPRWDPGSILWPGILSCLAVLLVAAALFRFRARWPRAVPFGLAQFAIATIPTSGIIAFGYMDKSFVADHFLYLPSWGFWMAFFSLVEWMGARALRRPALTLGLAMTAAFTPLTVAYARSWRDSETFWTHVLERNPRSWVAYGDLGQWNAGNGRLDAALSDLREAVRLKPDYVEAWFNLGYTLDRLGRMEEAEQAYQASLRLSPENPDAHNNLGVLYLRSGDLARARGEFQAALALTPNDPRARLNLRRLETAEQRAAGGAAGPPTR